jgi:hypothetical protein
VFYFEKSVLRGEIAVLLVDNGNYVNFWELIYLFIYFCVRNVLTCENDHQHE